MITASEHGDRVELRVIDHGPGIPDGQRDQVFRRSSGSATATTAPASVSASPCPAAWPRRWAAPWSRRPPPAAG